MSLMEQIASTFRRSKIGVGTIDYAAGQVKGIEIPNAMLQKGITLRLSGSVTIGTAAATIFSEAPLGLLKNIQIIGDGRRELVSASGARLFRISQFVWGMPSELSAPGTAVGTRTFSATINIDHELLQAMNPVETLLDPRVYKVLKLNVLWGALADIGTAGGGGTLVLNTVTLDVQSDQTADGVDQIMGDRVLFQDVVNVQASSPRLAVKVPQNGILIGLMLDTTRDAGAGAGPVPVDDVINTVSLKSDQTVAHMDACKWSVLQREAIQKYNVAGGASAGAAIPGYLYIPMMENGMISSCLNTNALNNLQLVLDVTRTSGTENIGVLYEFLEPRRSVAQAIA